MDILMRPITEEDWQDRGYAAYLDGHGPDDHGLTDRSSIKHFQFGWHTARVEKQQLAEVSPP